MKLSNITMIVSVFLSTFIFTSCSSNFQLINPGEQFKNITQITFHEEDDERPVISKDGTILLFVSKRDGNSNIYLKKNILSKSVIRKTNHEAEDIHPTFSPDNEQIVFSSNRNGSYDIYVMNTSQGLAKTQITDSRDSDLSPDWSPDGKLIAFSRLSSMDAQWYIWTKNLETGELTQIGRGLMPKFSSDSKRILYKKSAGDDYFQLWIMDLNGENDTQITSSSDWGVGTFCWSPDNNSVLFSTTKLSADWSSEFTDNADSDLWLIRTDGTSQSQITTHKGVDYSPFWSSDNYIYFSSDRNNQVNIWRFKYDY